MPTDPQQWDVDDVCDFLEGLKLGTLVQDFRRNAVDGKDLLDLSAEEFERDLHCSNLQVKKIKAALKELSPAASAGATPAAARPAANDAAKGGALRKANFAADDLATYKGLQAKISGFEAEQVEAKAMEAKRRANDIYTSLTAASRRVQGLEGARKKAAHDVEACGTFYVRKLFMSKAKQRAKLEGKQHVLDDADKELAAAKETAATLDRSLGDTKRVADEAQGKVDALVRARYEQTALVERIFAAPDWASDPTLVGAVAAMKDLDRQAAEAGSHAAACAQAGGLLQSARGKIDQSLQGLRRTRFMAGMGAGMALASGPGRRRPGPMMMDVAEMMHVQRANDWVKSAAADVTRARQVLPSLPFTNEAVLKSATMGVFVSALSGGSFAGNMVQRMMIRKSIESVQQMEVDVRQCHEWVQRNAAAANARSSQLLASSAAAKAEMVGYQRTQLAAALAQ